MSELRDAALAECEREILRLQTLLDVQGTKLERAQAELRAVRAERDAWRERCEPVRF